MDAGPDPRLRMANAALRAGDTGRAIDLLRGLTTDRPRDGEAWRALGSTLVSLGRAAEGIRALRKAVQLEPKRPAWRAELGRALVADLQHAAGIAELTRAHRAAPRDATVLATLANAQHRARQNPAARASADKALAIDPGATLAAITLVRLDLLEKQLDPAERRLRPLTDSRDVGTRALAWHLLGTIMERRERWDDAFDAHMAGNAAFAELPEAEAARQRGRHLRIPEFLGDGHEACYRSWSEQRIDDGAGAPVFLVGFPRSGTTLAEQILAAHPGMTSSDERSYLEVVYQRAVELAGDPAPERFLAALDGLTEAHLRELRALYWAEARADLGSRLSGKRLVDKNPVQLLDVGLIARAFPEARVVVILRDPRDACLSALFQPFDLNSATVQMLDAESIGAYYETFMGFWVTMRRLAPVAFLEVRYEELVADLEAHARAMLEFSGLEWDDRVLRFHEAAAKRAVGSASSEQVTERVHGRSVEKWRRYSGRLGPLFERLAGISSHLGYSVDVG